MSEPISVLIADDHAVVRAGLRLLLASQRDIRVAGECGTHGDVLAFLQKAPRAVDILTLDITMPGGSPAVARMGASRPRRQTGSRTRPSARGIRPSTR